MVFENLLDVEALVQHLPLFVWIYLLVILAVMVDLGTAIHYCKRAKIPIMSYKMRKTIDKLIRYFGLLFIASTIDTICFLVQIYDLSGFASVPFATGVAGILLCLIEGKSVFEHRDPEKKKLLIKTAESLLEGLKKQDIKEILNYLSEKEEDDGKSKDDTEGTAK